MSIIRDIAEEEHKLQMTPMIDVTFLLLIFFMCTLKFKTLEGKLAAYLPKDVGVNTDDSDPIEKVEITVEVVTEGTKLNAWGTEKWEGKPGTRFVYGPDRVIEYKVGPQETRDLKKLQRRLAVLRKSDEKRPATIDARKGTVYSDIVKVLDACLEVGFEEVTFVGSYE